MPSLGTTTLALLLVAGCGRLDFDVTRSSSDAAIDAIPGTSGLVAFYPMEDLVQNSTVMAARHTTDATGHGHDALCNASECPTLVMGRTGLAAQFTGSGQRMHTSGSPQDLETTSGFTVTAWISIPALPQSRGCVVTKTLGTQLFNSWAICVESNGTLFFYTVTGTTTDELFSRATVSLNTWHHVAIRWTGAVKIVSLDGIDDATSLAVTDFDGGQISIGADLDNGATVAPFNGLVDDVRIYNRALSSTELAELAR